MLITAALLALYGRLARLPILPAIEAGTIRNFVRRLGMIGAKELDNAATQGTSHT
jgi:hypothetical protein